MRSIGRIAPLLSIAALAFTSRARAEWPAARHDPQRSGVTDGVSDILEPKVKWRYYLGGSISGRGLITADADGDGKLDLVLATGGSITAVRLDDSHIWEASTLGAATMLGIFDLDGDGKQEVVAYINQGARAYDLATGALVWSQPPFEMGMTETARVADVNGDGRPDVVIGECRGCGGGKMQTGFIYSFENGLGAPHRIELPYPDTSVSFELALADMDGMGGAEILLGSPDHVFRAVDGATGMVIASSPDLALPQATVTYCYPADLDGVVGQEVVCVSSPSSDPMVGGDAGAKVFALKLVSGSIQPLWTYTVPASEALSNAYNELVVELDGDGIPEVVVTGRDASGGYTTHILRATTGTQLTPIPGERYIGSATVLANGKRALFTKGASGLVSVWSFDANAPQKVVSHGSFKAEGIASQPDWAHIAISGTGAFQPITVDLNGDGFGDVVSYQATAPQVIGYSVAANQPAPLGTLTFPKDAPLIGLWSLSSAPGAAQLMSAQANGILQVLDAGLQTTATLKFGGFYAAGGYYQLGLSPIVGAVDGAAQRIVTIDSRKAMLMLDASSAGSEVAPVKLWEQLDNYSPVILKSTDGDGSAIASIRRDSTNGPPTYFIRAVRANGGMLWESPIDYMPSRDITIGNFDGDGIPDIALQAGATNQPPVSTYAISGKDGHIIWSTTLTGCGQPGGLSVVDWNGDGLDDVIQQAIGIHVTSGKDGSEIAFGGPTDCYNLPLPIDADGDGLHEVILQGGYNPESMYAHDLQTKVFAATEDDRPYPYGAIAHCDGGPVLLEGSWAFPSRLKITQLAGATPGAATSVFLGGGSMFTDELGASQAGSGQLTSVGVHANLRGEGRPSALVGSADGWLYAIDPCLVMLQFSYDFHAPVGEPIFGDTDGDGLDEILVSVADGYLYSLWDGIEGTGGSGGAGSGGGGAGGSGGSSTHPREEFLLYGRAGCYCDAGRAPLGSAGSLAFAIGLVAALARARRRAQR